MTIPIPEHAAAIRLVPLAELKEHPENPRKHFDEVSLAELAESIREKGVLNPPLVRPNGRGWQILAGARRYRASKLAGLEHVQVLVRELDDDAALELMIVDNLQREDVHPLEEAAGFASLMNAGYDVAKVAGKIGRSEKYVYDRVKLLQLIPELREVFLAGEITAGHAILLARLEPGAQKRALEGRSNGYNVGGLFQHDHGRDVDQLDLDEDLSEEEWDAEETRRNRKAVSVRELARWIDDEVRFDPEKEDLPNLFPETGEALAIAEEAELKVVHITRDYQLRPEARAEGRTYTRPSWKRADDGPDSEYHGPTSECEHRVMGVVVAGPGRGEAFYVCTNKKKCDVHWKAERKAATQRAKGGASSGAAAPGSYEQKRREAAQKEEAKRARWRVAQPKLRAAIAEAVPAAPIQACMQLLMKAHDIRVPKGRRIETADELVRMMAQRRLQNLTVHLYWVERDLPRALKPFGVDAKKIVRDANPKPKPEKKAKPKAAKKTTAKKSRAKKKAAADA